MKRSGLLMLFFCLIAWAADSWRIVIPPAGEPGEPLVVTGTIYRADGKSPAVGAVMEMYHTDARGYYSPDGKNEREHRLKGRLVTGADGRYEFRTIKPAPYPGNKIPAHIHVSINGQEASEYQFAGDPNIPADAIELQKTRGRFSYIVKLDRGGDGVWRAARDFRLDALK
jgi:protocatechuate 3,4-dioxygenase beta subunit